MQKSVLVAGSHGTIGNAVTKQLKIAGYEILTISRGQGSSLNHLNIAMTEPESVEVMEQWLAERAENLAGVIHCVGFLHDEVRGPEKNLKQLSADWLNLSMRVNVISHIHVAQALNSIVTRQSNLRWLSLSAKVGSIEDNGLGGWYSYRMSKAALNMFIKNLSIEWGRRAANSSVIAMHPGTTPSGLSDPFIQNWPKDKLYSPDLTAERIVSVFESMSPEGTGKLYHHDGSVIPW
ncbi:SDR family oxidoreductase [Grimontia sp. NTOU-MAR1]|uniref:SDR family oxidoreductase n=1 Tax=Grimontia sp. NTOU-MAR1 TaxID=3111011 RepID=UPI002DBDA9DF|nr:SDR family oxidoreductase [Grimontia sp. NTOU-MAR1]WRV99969.1 SDR family oxidoreductase [Grimontia sp. NTOU-MAR1]